MPPHFRISKKSSFLSAAIAIRKIFEEEKRHPLNSIDGVMSRLGKRKYSATQAKNVERFGRKYGNHSACAYPAAFLRSTIDSFKLTHEVSLRQLREFRNQYAAHSQFGAELKNLPSINEFEELFDFAVDFYKLISDGILNIGPASFPPDAGMGLLQTLKNLGLTGAQFDFPPKT